MNPRCRVGLLVLFSLLACEIGLAATYSLTTTTNGSGAVTRNPDSAAYPEGGVVTLTAVPAAGWHFSSWTGDIIGTLNPTNVLMNSAKTITANFSVSCPGTNVVSVASEAALRSAIAAGGHVRLCLNGTIVLTSTISVTNDAELDATGASVIIDGNNAVRLFRVSPGVQFIATNLVLINGRCVGTNGAASQDGEAAAGAGIFNDGGNVLLSACTLSNHSVVGGNGGNGTQVSPRPGNGGRGLGAAIYNISGTCLLMETLCVSNTATAGIPGIGSELATTLARGGAVYGTNSTLIAIRSKFIGNTVSCRALTAAQTRTLGGAVCADASTLSMTNVSLVGNSSIGQSDTGGSLNAPGAFGGAIALILGDARLDRINVASNMAMGGYARLSSAGEGLGGGLYLNGQVDLRASTIRANVASGGGGQNARVGQGGGIYNLGELAINGCTIDGNLARGGDGRSFSAGGFPGADAGGGGIWDGGISRITNSTITANSSQGGNPGFFDVAPGAGVGGGIGSGQAWLMNVTLASNFVAGGGGWGTPGQARGANVFSGGVATMQNSILAGVSNNLAGTITDAGYNISSDGSAAFTSRTSFNFTDPKLLPLANNGGPTLTMALAADSPAIDWVQAAGVPGTDQRGVPRPLGNASDVGAFEFGAERAVLALTRKAGALELAFPVKAGVPYQIQFSRTPPAWEVYESLGTIATNGVIIRTLPITPGSRFFRVSTY